MRYYRITLTRHDAFLRWVHFERRRPWLDLEQPDCILTLMLLGEGAGLAGLRFEDRTGAEVPHESLPDAEVPAGLPDFAQADVAKRQLLRLRVPFAGPAPIYLRRAADGLLLLTLTPEIQYPDFLFALMRECAWRLGIPGFRNFVETGTLLGHTTLHASYWFDKVWTVELSETLWREACKALAGRGNVTCLHGNSADVLPDLVSGLNGPSLFLLDAHWSGDDSVDWDASRFAGYPVETARLAAAEGRPETERQVPLMAELRAVTEGHSGQAVIVIDDWGSLGQTGFGFQGEDWSTLGADALRSWIKGHPRTLFHFPADQKRYVWGIG